MGRSNATIDSLEKRFERRRREFLEEHEGQWVLLWPNGDAEFFDSENEALEAGYTDRKRSGPFTVKEVLEEDRAVFLTHICLSDPQ